MKLQMNHATKHRRSVFPLLLAIFIGILGCSTTTPDPLAGWKMLYGHNSEAFDTAVKDNYREYLEELPKKQKGFVGPIQFFAGGGGQHAVRIEIALNGTDWTHILIYDNTNNRIKVIRYASGHYRS
jgi:hypothetical protein